MRNTTWFIVAVLVVGVGCGSKKDDAGKAQGSAGSGSAVAGSGSAASGSGSGGGSAAPAPAAGPLISALPALDAAAVCADSALLLVDTPYAKAGKRFCDVCGATNPNACTGTWPDDFIAAGAAATDRADLLRNAIYAAYGYPFKKEKWTKLFGGKAWYKRNEGFKDADLTRTAVDNVSWLKTGRKSAGVELELTISKTLTGEADLDGDGKPEAIALDPGGEKLTAGAIVIASTEHPPEDFGADPLLLAAAVLDIDRKTPGKQLALYYSTYEDLNMWAIYDVAGGKATFVGHVPYGDVAGDGTVVLTDTNCAVTTVTTFKLKKGKGFVQAGDKKTGTYDVNECYACPYVYLRTARGVRFQGEVLRNQVGAEDYRLDALALADAALIADGVIRIELREVKPETTFLDAIQLEIAGELVDPIDCDGTGTPCAVDQRFAEIRQGQRRVFAFAWAGAAPASLTLRATGYYVPDGR